VHTHTHTHARAHTHTHTRTHILMHTRAILEEEKTTFDVVLEEIPADKKVSAKAYTALVLVGVCVYLCVVRFLNMSFFWVWFLKRPNTSPANIGSPLGRCKHCPPVTCRISFVLHELAQDWY
jgi:hypothetical protein